MKRTPEGVNLVGSLCHLYNASEEDVSCMVTKLNKMMEDLLKLPLSDVNSGDSPQLSGINSGVYRSFFYFMFQTSGFVSSAGWLCYLERIIAEVATCSHSFRNVQMA